MVDYKHGKKQCSAYFLNCWEGLTQLSPRKCVNRNAIQQSKNTFLHNYLFSECKLKRYFLSSLPLPFNCASQMAEEEWMILNHHMNLCPFKALCGSTLLPSSPTHSSLSSPPKLLPFHFHCLHPFQTCFKTGFDILNIIKYFESCFNHLLTRSPH